MREMEGLRNVTSLEGESDGELGTDIEISRLLIYDGAKSCLLSEFFESRFHSVYREPPQIVQR